MAHSDKDIVITPNKGSTTDNPTIVFSGANASTGPQNITVTINPNNSGTLIFQNSFRSLITVASTGTSTGVVFAVTDTAGNNAVELVGGGDLRLVAAAGSVTIGGSTAISSGKLSVYAGGAGGVSWGTGFNLGSAANYTSQIQDASIARWRNVGAGGYQWYNGAGTAQRMILSDTGNLTISGEIVATRLVDADNNAYFIDPAGTSNLNIVNIAGGSNRDTFGAERRYYLGNLTANATQAREHEIARVYIDFNDWHEAGTIFVELQNYYYFGGDTQIWSISYDYNNVNCDLMWGNSPRGRLARVRAGSPTQANGLTGDSYYIPIYVDVRYYGQYYTYLRTSWPEVTAHANGLSGRILVYTTPTPVNIADFTPPSSTFTNNNITTNNNMEAALFQEYGNTGRYVNPDGASVIGALTANGRLIVNNNTSAGGIYLDSANDAYITANRTATADGDVGFKFSTAAAVRWTNYLATNDNNTLRWLSATGTVLTLNQAGALVASDQVQAPIFYDKDDTAYYLDPAAGAPSSAPGKSAVLRGHILQQTLMSRPYVVWGASNVATGQVVIRLPGTIANYGMVHAVIDIYEYSGNNVATAIIGGHNWNNGQWYNFGCNLIGYTDKQIRLGVVGNQFCISIGSNTSTWNYGQVVLRKIQNGSYYAGSMDLGGTYSITLETNIEASYTNISSDLRQLRSAGSFTTTGYIYGTRFVDYDNNAYYVDPASGSVLGGSITKDGKTVPWVAIQDTAPTATQAGDLWWESDVGRLKIWYNDGTSSQWVDATPVPDLSLYLPKTGGTLTGPLVSNSYIIAQGYIQSNTSLRANRFTDQNNTFLFQAGSASGTTRHINLADSTADPSSVGSATGITAGQRSDNQAYYMIYVKSPYNNGYSTHSRLVLGWHTGVEIGGDASYGGTRFMNNSPGVSTVQLMSIGAGDAHVRVNNDLFAARFLDIDNSAYFLNPASDRVSNIYGFTAFTVEGTKGTYKYNTPRWAHTSDTNYWVGSMGWGTNSLDSVFDWGSGYADSWGSPSASPGDTSHYLISQAVHYTTGSTRYGWQLAGGVTDSLWWRHVWGGGFSQWFKIAMYGNNASAGSALYANQFIDSDNTAYFADPSSISNMYLIQGKLYTNTADYTGTENPAIKTWTGVLCAGSDFYGAQAYTFIRTKVRFDSYMMGGVTIDWFENYGSTNAKTQICLGGYWNPPSNGGMIGFEYTSTNPNIRPTIVVGYDAQGYTCFRLTHFNSSYAQIVVRDLWLGYSGGNTNMGDSNWQGLSNGWQLIQSGDANYNSFTGQVTVQPRLAVAMDSVSLMTAAIGRGSHMGGFLQGSYNSVGANEGRSNPIYTIGSAYNPTETALSNMYGIGYTNPGFGSINHRSDWGMYVAANGVIRVWLDGSSGRVIGVGNFYAPTFVDYNSTGYYMTPSGTTQLRTVYADDWFRPQGTTGIYFQSYDRGLRSPDGEGNSYGNVATYGTGRNGWLGWGIGSRWVLMSTGGDNIGIHDNSNTWLYYWDGSYHRFNRGYVQAQGSMRAPTFIDSDDGNYYCDPNSTSVLARIILPQNPVGTSYSGNANVPTFYIGQTSGDNDAWKIYGESPSGSNTGALILQSEDDFDSNESIRLRFKRTYSAFNTNDTLIAQFDRVTINGSLFSDNWQLRTNTFYNIDSGGSASLLEVYSNGWFRNRNSGQGLYNQSTGMHWYTNNGYWKAAGGAYGYGGVLLYNNYESDLRGYLYYDGGGFGLLNSSGNWQFRIEYGNANAELYRITYGNDFRAYIYYHRGSESYYLQPASTSVLWRPSANTQQRWSATWRAMDNGNHRPNFTGDQNYWTTTHGWGTGYGTWANNWQYGFGGFDCWGTGTDHPQGGGYVHAQGIQSGLHYATSDGSSAYGWQMVGAGDAANRWWLRGKWGGTVRPWYEIALYDNNSTSGSLYADYFYDRDTSYYVNGNSWSRLWGVGTFYLRNNYDVSADHPFGMYMAEGLSTAYAVYRESGGWSYPYPDLRLAFHTGIKFGANPSYEGMRFYTDYDMSSMIFQVNGSSNYLFKYVWMYTNGTGYYSDVDGAHWFPNGGNSSYGSWRMQGNRNGWYGFHVIDGNGYRNHYMWENGNGGTYNQDTGIWCNYYSRGNNCTGFGTSSTNGSYGIYVVKGVYSEGNVVAYSDIRAKDNIVTIDNALEKVEKMRGVFFNYKRTPEKRDVGVIAQEMQDALPEVVDYDKDNDKYSVAYGNLTAVLIEAVKELSAEVKRLKQKLGEE